jgi:hypothetical protein
LVFFYRIPRIRSERPAFELHYPHIKTGAASRSLTQRLTPPAQPISRQDNTD